MVNNSILSMPVHDDVGRRSVLRNATTIAGAISISGLAGCLSDIGGGGESGAENYPQDDVEIIVPYSSGGGFDAYARLTEPYWAENLGGDVIVTNVEGGGGINGATQAYNAAPDGHTILIWDAYQSLTVQMAQDVDYDITEMSHIGLITNNPSALILTDDVDINNFDEFINQIDELRFATQGAGSAGHSMAALLGRYLEDTSEDDLNYVHFNGTGEVVAGLERGEANAFLISTITSGVSTVHSLNNASIFIVFDQEDEIGWFLEQEDVSTEYYSPMLDIENIEEYNEVAYDRRFFTGPPEVPEDILEIQRDAFSQMIDTDEMVNEMEESNRPVINPGNAQDIENYLTETSNALNENRDLFENIMS